MSYDSIEFYEECYKIGGVGMLLASKLYSSGYRGDFEINAFDNEYIDHAPFEDVCKAYHLDSDSIREKYVKRYAS